VRKSQIKMFDDLVYDFIIINKGNNSHGSPAFGTDEGVDLIDLFYHLSPTFGWQKRNLKEMTLNLVPSQHAKLVKVCADSPRNTTRLLTLFQF